jgi:hypothetical protein
MTVSLKALNRVLCFEIILFHYLLEEVIVVWHLLKTRVESGFPICWEAGLLEPRVLPDRGYGCAFLRIRVQNLGQDVAAFIGDKFWDLIVSAQNLLIKLGSFRILKRQVSADHGVEYNARAPDIGLKAVISLSSNHLQNFFKG